MKKYIVILMLLFIYIIFYKSYFIYFNEAVTYIVNPLVWIAFFFAIYFFLKKNKERNKHSFIVMSVVTIASLIYVILYYSLGLLVGYTNNPFSTNISGIVINFFSLWLVVCLKEYIRYYFLNLTIHKYKILYFIFLFLVFFISDLNFYNVVESNDLINLWAEELILPATSNLFMMYISYVGNYKSAIISRSILLLPSLIFSVVPNYEWFIILLFHLIYFLIIYLLLQYILGKMANDIPPRLASSFNPYRWIGGIAMMFLLIAFGAGFFNIKPMAILTGSMEPLIGPGDMVIIERCEIEDVEIGDIIQFKLQNYSVVHRVVKIIYDDNDIGLITKGDANKNIDKIIVRKGQVVGKLIFNVPYIGYPAYFIRNIVNNSDEVDIEQGGL